MKTATEVAALLRDGVAASLDTCVAGPKNGLLTIARLCQQARTAGGVSLKLSTPAFAESLRQLRAKFGKDCDPSFPGQMLENFAEVLSVADFTREDAAGTAARVHARYPSDEEWRRFKARQALHGLRLGDREELLKVNTRCSATVDWLIAGQAERRGWLLVTNDKQAEFAHMELKTNFERLREALASLASGDE